MEENQFAALDQMHESLKKMIEQKKSSSKTYLKLYALEGMKKLIENEIEVPENLLNAFDL